MVALARLVSLELLHAHTNCAPSANDTDWYSEKRADSMLIAQKPYDGQPKYPDLKVYKCFPENKETLRGGLVPYTRKKGIERLWEKVRKRLL
jgi:hypothetical protein